jgi:hypothetical protein
MANIARWDYKFKLTPKVDFDACTVEIEEHIASPFDEVIGNYYKTIVNTKDKMIRDGLIALGWTPPEDGFNG